jgi:phage terminase large subunit
LIQAAESKLRVLCTREVQNSIKDSVHKLLSDQIQALGLGAFYNVTEQKITGLNGSEFVFAGLSNLTAESIKSYEGVDRCWVEEAHKVRRRSWDILVPTIRKDGSEIWITMNPELDSDESYKRFIESPPQNAKVVEINWRDNPWFPAVLEEERVEFLRQVHAGKRSQVDYDNIWEGKCRAAVEGAIFANELAKCKSSGRIGAYPWDSGKLVYTSWDLGKRDTTAIWFYQIGAGSRPRFIDYFEDNGEDITYYLERLVTKGYKYATHYLPHDAKQDRLGMPKTIEAVVRDNGFRVEVIPVRSLKDQINEARLLLARCEFDSKCAAGLEALRHYHWGFNKVMEELKPEPVHDWSSHGSSAFMGAALSLKSAAPVKQRPIRYDNRGVV